MAGENQRQTATSRTCIVSRQILDIDRMIRFVAGPDMQVVPDLKRALPGRGVWVTANRALVEQAVKKKAFARGLKTAVKADQALPELVDKLLTEQALGAIGFARKAGECVTGAGKVQSALLEGKVSGLLHASNGADDGIRKLNSAARQIEAKKGKPLKVWKLFDTMQLDLALGTTNVIHAALTKGGAAKNAKRRVAQLAAYRDDRLPDVAQKDKVANDVT